MLYTVSQDQTIKAVDIASFETVCAAKKAVVGMVDIIGIYGDALYVAGGRNPLTAWDKRTLKPLGVVDFPGDSYSVIGGNRLYSRDKTGVYEMILD